MVYYEKRKPFKYFDKDIYSRTCKKKLNNVAVSFCCNC